MVKSSGGGRLVMGVSTLNGWRTIRVRARNEQQLTARFKNNDSAARGEHDVHFSWSSISES
jgi:hypothetical protein